MMKRLAPSQWMRKVDALLQEAPTEYVVVAVEGENDDGTPAYRELPKDEDGSLQFNPEEPGTYRLIDSNGKPICECTVVSIGAGRVRRGTPNDVQAVIARQTSALGEQWHIMNATLAEQLQEEREENKRLRKEINVLREELLSSQGGLENAVVPALIGKADVLIDLLQGNKKKQGAADLANKLLGRLSEGARSEVLKLLPAEFTETKEG